MIRYTEIFKCIVLCAQKSMCNQVSLLHEIEQKITDKKN